MKRDEPVVVSSVACLVTAGIFLVGLITLAIKLREVQVEDIADYDYASKRQSVRRVQTPGLRGRILDRHGTLLAGNRRSITIVCECTQFQRRSWAATVAAIDEAIGKVAKIVGIASPLTTRQIERHVHQSLAMPLTVWRGIESDALARFSEREAEFPGFAIIETAEREYPLGPLAAHLIGYVGRDRGEVATGEEKFNFYFPEMRGRSGLESYYDGYLRGVPGERRLLVDARGFAIREWPVTEALPGPDLKLTLDVSIQQLTEAQLKGRKGAAVVLDPQNGEVLAMASSPGFNLNDFVPTLSPELYERHAHDQAKPLLNRACAGAYAPGSTFKPITALAALSAGLSANEPYECIGAFECGTMILRCSSRWGHGSLDLTQALAKSCNPYFCNAAVMVGTNRLIAVARALGLGEKTGLDFGVDMAGAVPDAEWKEKMYHERWYPGDLPQMAIGQGMLLVSPLQMARVAGAIGTGYLVTPHLKLSTVVRRKKLPFAEADLAIVRQGMRMVVDGGTGRLGGEGVAVEVSGKTGTAEVGLGERRRKNAWFIAYAPSASPTVAVAMVIENGESGGGTAAPLVAEILKGIFNDR